MTTNLAPAAALRPVVLLLDASLHITSVGVDVGGLFGQDPSQLEGQHVATLLKSHQAQPAQHRGHHITGEDWSDVFAALAPGEALCERWQWRPDGGTPRLLDVVFVPVHDDEHRLSGGTLILNVVPTDHATRDQLVNSEEQFRLVFDKSPAAMAVVSLAEGTRGRIRRANPALERLTGRRRRELYSMVMADVLHPDERLAHHSYLRSAAEDALTEPDGVLRRFVHRDGSQRLGRKSTALVSPRGAREPYLLVQIDDVTDERAALQALADSEEQFRLVFDQSPTAMAVVGLAKGSRGRIRRTNPAMAAFSGHSVQSLLTMRMWDLLLPEEHAAHLRHLRLAAEVGECEPDGVLRRFLHLDGSLRHARKFTALVTPQGAVEPYLLVQLHDVTEQHAAQQALAHAALHDSLTGLANRALFGDRLEHALAVEGRAQRGLTLLYADLDRFKPINDEHGHDAGDAVLIEVADRLRRGVREEDTVARLGGDEFAVICPGLAAEHVDTVIGRMLASVAQPFALPSGLVLDLEVSIGSATTVGWIPATDFLKAADAAMYDRKRAAAAAGPMYQAAPPGEPMTGPWRLSSQRLAAHFWPEATSGHAPAEQRATRK